MFSNDLIADGFRPDVRKIVLALDTADSQPFRLDFILQPQMRHVDALHFADSMSMEGECWCFCINDQHWFFCKTQVAHHALDTLRFWRSQRRRTQFCFRTAVSLSPAQRESEKTVSSELMNPNPKTWIHCLCLRVPNESLQIGKAAL